MRDPNYWVTRSITGDGSNVLVSDRDGGVIEAFETEAEANAERDRLNAEEQS